MPSELQLPFPVLDSGDSIFLLPIFVVSCDMVRLHLLHQNQPRLKLNYQNCSHSCMCVCVYFFAVHFHPYCHTGHREGPLIPGLIQFPSLMCAAPGYWCAVDCAAVVESAAQHVGDVKDSSRDRDEQTSSCAGLRLMMKHMCVRTSAGVPCT